MGRHFATRDACPVCSHPSPSTIYERAYADPVLRSYLDRFYGDQGGVEHEFLADARYVLMRCPSCTLVFQRDVPDELVSQKLYEEWIDPRKAFRLYEYNDVEKTLAIAGDIADLLRHLDRPPTELRALDFGMGWGQWCVLARGFGCQVAGAELSEARLRYARELAIPTMALEDVPPEGFDVVNAEQVLEHLPDPRSVMERLAEAVAPGGVIAVGVPDGWDIRLRLLRERWDAPKTSRWSLNCVAPLEHLNCFNHDSLVRLAAEVGFAPVEVQRAHAFTTRDRLKSRVKPLYHRVRRKPGTSLVFGRSREVA